MFRWKTGWPGYTVGCAMKRRSKYRTHSDGPLDTLTAVRMPTELLRALDGAARMLKTSRSELLRWAAERCLAEAIVKAVPVARSKDASPGRRLAALKIIRQSDLAALVRRLPREELDRLREGLSRASSRSAS